MPYRGIPGLPSSTYAFITFDADGMERMDDPASPGGKFSDRVLEDLKSSGVTDVFIVSHGWKGDVPSAVDQYDRWITSMVKSSKNIEAAKGLSDDFKPFWIGLHWPSLPWGDEELGDAASFSDMSLSQKLIDIYVERLGNLRGMKEAVTTIVRSAASDPAPEELPDEVASAYVTIHDLLAEQGAESVSASPALDREPFVPSEYYQAAQEAADYGLGIDLGGVLAPLRQLSFWRMKQRARTVGENGMREFLRELQAPSMGSLRVHLMGHSFGCIVVSSMLQPNAENAVTPPVSSLTLVQGAMSIWSFCEDIPVAQGKRGYFNDVLKRVAGPIVTTRSSFDKAVGTFYPLGAGVAGQVDFATDPKKLPKYGAIGAFGAQALNPAGVDLPMLPVSSTYAFIPGKVYNVESSEFICKGDGSSGAHSDIDGPEVAHLFWSAALAGIKQAS